MFGETLATQLNVTEWAVPLTHGASAAITGRSITAVAATKTQDVISRGKRTAYKRTIFPDSTPFSALRVSTISLADFKSSE